MKKSFLIVAILASVFVVFSVPLVVHANDFHPEQSTEDSSTEGFPITSENDLQNENFPHGSENPDMENPQESPSSDDLDIKEIHKDAMTPEESPESETTEEDDSDKKI